jgi:hypothetical protein
VSTIEDDTPVPPGELGLLGDDQPMAKPECDHFYASHCYRGMSVRLCQFCHEPDWDDVARELAAARADAGKSCDAPQIAQDAPGIAAHAGTAPEPSAATSAPFLADLRRQVSAVLDAFPSVDRSAGRCGRQAAAVMAVITPALEHAMSAAAGSHEGVHLWMLDCGRIAERARARADAADAILVAVVKRCRDSGEQVADAILRIIAGEGEAASDEH